MHVLGGADVDPTGRLCHDEHVGVGRELPGNDDLLDVAARQVRGLGAQRRGLHREAAHQLPAALGNGAELQQPAADEGRLVVVDEHQVLRHAHLADGAVAHAFLRHERHAAPAHLLRRRCGNGLAANLHGAGLDGPQAEDRFGQLALPVARHPGNPDDLPARHLHRKVVERDVPPVAADSEAVDHQALVARVLGGHLAAQPHLSPHHHRRQTLTRGLRRRGAPHHLTVPQHRDLVGDDHYLGQLVGDEDEPAAFVGQRSQRGEQVVHFGRREHRRRLVEHQQPCFPIQRLENLRPLTLADSKLPDVRIGVDGESVAFGHLHQPLPHRRHVREASAPVQAQRHVLGHRQRRHQHEVLVDHADPVVNRGGRRGNLDRCPLDPDLAFVGPVQAVEDLHQRALAGAVLPQQRVDLAGLNSEVDVLVRDDARETLGDAGHLQHRRSRGRALQLSRC